jgi:hypothetical protein
MKKFLNKRSIIIATTALVLLFAFALFNPYVNLVEKAFAAAGYDSAFSKYDTSDFKNLQMPDKGGNIIYSISGDKTSLWSLNCNTGSIKSMGKVGVKITPSHGTSSSYIRAVPGYFNSKDKLSWLIQSRESLSDFPLAFREDWFIDGNTGNKSKLNSQVLRQRWNLKATTSSVDGRTAVWYNLDPRNQTTESQWLENVPDENWIIIGAGDVNGDKKGEILWYNIKTKQTAIWTYRNSRHEGLYLPSNLISRPHELIGLADCDGDGKSELIFRDSDSQGVYLGYWKIDPNTMTSMQGDKKVITRDTNAVLKGFHIRAGTF